MRQCVVAIVNSERCNVDRAMHLVRCLSFFLARWGVSLRCRNLPGAQNGAADALSRNALPSFQRLVPEANKGLGYKGLNQRGKTWSRKKKWEKRERRGERGEERKKKEERVSK